MELAGKTTLITGGGSGIGAETARYMAARKDQWRGKLMLLVQPGEERLIGARMMMEDKLLKLAKKHVITVLLMYN